MGTLTSALSQISTTIGTLNAIESGIGELTGNNGQRKSQRAQQDLALRNLQDTQALSESEARAKAERDRKQIALTAQQNEDARRKALKRAIARQNVNRGAGGVSATGSNEAILLGLYNDSDDNRAQASQLDQLRYNTIDSGLLCQPPFESPCLK